MRTLVAYVSRSLFFDRSCLMVVTSGHTKDLHLICSVWKVFNVVLPNLFSKIFESSYLDRLRKLNLISRTGLRSRALYFSTNAKQGCKISTLIRRCQNSKKHSINAPVPDLHGDLLHPNYRTRLQWGIVSSMLNSLIH